jgi:glucose/arabinose dehydrogenase
MTMKTLMLATAAAALLAACNADTGQAQTSGATGGPLETRPPNAQDQAPVKAGQTRAPEMKAGVEVEVGDYVTGLEKPWGLAFLPDGALLVTEKAGRLRIASGGRLSEPVAGVPAVEPRGQGGLLGLAVDPRFADNGYIYLAFSEPRGGRTTSTSVARGRLVRPAEGAPRLEAVQVIWRQQPALDSGGHYGARLVFAPDGTLYITTGDRQTGEGRDLARKRDTGVGKVIRINADGTIPKDNPFVGQPGALPEVFSIGHRNIQSAAVHPTTGDLWEVEHGTRGGDELNIVKKAADYGWPDVAYGVEYSGRPIREGDTAEPGVTQPIYYWDPVIAPSGMAFYTADLVPAWKGSLLVGGLGPKFLVRLTLDGDRVVGEERLLTEVGERLRDVIVGPDGALYVATDNDKGRVLRVAPRTK